MDYQNILSNEFRELDLIAKKQKENYISAYPFPHITVRNFFSNDFLITRSDRGIKNIFCNRSPL